MKRSIVLFAFLAALAAAGGAQSIPGRGPFRIEMDFARFSAEDSYTFLEVYYGIPEACLSFLADSGMYRASARLRLEVRSDTGTVASKEWLVPHAMKDTSELAMGQSLMGIVSVAVPKGEYRISLAVHDANSPSRRDSMTAPISVKGFEDTRESLSDIELCTTIRQSGDKGSVFYKNTLEVIPNASRMYGIGLPILQYYVEVYNLANAHGDSHVLLRTSVINGAGKEVKQQSRTKPRLHNSTVEVGTVNLSGLGSGSYRLRLALVDTMHAAEHLLATSEKKFFIYRVGSAADSIAASTFEPVGGGEFSFMTEEEVRQAFDYAQYVATESEESQYDRLSDLKGRQNFLADFWRRRDPDASTAVNEFKQAYYERIEYANKNLSNRINDGWKSDRGRVYVIYGRCDEVERVPSTAESLPYEVWHYEGMQGGVIFVFVDRNNFGNYTLVHSTHRNELHNENWLEEHARRVQ